jgi:hypothetical protein
VTKINGHSRVVAIGDLNGSLEALLGILRGLKLIDRNNSWKARGTHLIQVGDLFNRGGTARESLELLLKLQEQAPAKKSVVTVLLGNHEVMTALGNEAYCSVGEYLSFATQAQRNAWPGKVSKAMGRIYRDHPAGGPIAPLQPRVEAWKAMHAPGQAAMRRALGPRGKLGRSLRKLPTAIVESGCVFVHAPLTPRWARLGIAGLNAATAEAWADAPAFYRDLPERGIFRDTNGPHWNRRLVTSASAAARKQFTTSLKHLGAARMVVGHTMTQHIQGGKTGVISLRQGGKLVCIDVGLGRGTLRPCTALLIEDGAGREWTPAATRTLWRA